MTDVDDTDMFQGDGRRSEVSCQRCGTENLQLAIDPVDDELIVGCPECREDIAMGHIRFAHVELSFTTPDVDEVDPALRDDVKEALNE
jgi:NAD-dependent SIR2 family protein deacetylase